MEYSDFAWENQEYLLDILQNRAEQIVPEWKLDLEHPDIGTVLALLFTDMLAGSAKHFSLAVRDYPVHLYNMLGMDLLPSGEAGGYITFQTVNDEVPGAYVEQGSRVSGTDENGKVISYDTTEGLFVSSARYLAACFVDGQGDRISQLLSLPLRAEKLTDRQSHELYIGHSYLLGIMTEGELIVNLHDVSDLRMETPSPEMMDGVRWFYYSTDGIIPFSEQRYEEGRIYLLKKKSMPAFAPFCMQDENCFWLKAEMGKMKPGEEIVFPGLSLASAGECIQADYIYDGNMELGGEDFLPFGERPYVWQEVFICSGEVLSKKGAEITLSFDWEIIEFPGDIKTVPEMINWKNIMKESDFPKTEPTNVSISAVSFEYYNGMGFTRIPGMNLYSGLFGTESTSGSEKLIFQCPEDICSCLVSAMETWCIRIRICRLSAPYAVDGVYRMPRIKNCLLAYRYGEAGMFAEHAFCRNQLKEEAVACMEKSIPFYHTFPAEKMLYLAFSRAMNEEEIRILFQILEGNQQMVFSCRYEYYGQTGWQILKVYDDTLSLSRTGTISFTAEHDFRKKDFFGLEGYWIRIIWEAEENNTIASPEKEVLPPIEGIYINSVAAAAVPGSGSMGNLPSGAVNSMGKSIGFISRVENIEAMSGGYDAEVTEQAVKRGATVLRHRNRAVTARDYEDIVQSRVRSIRQVRCFSGRNASGEKQPGHITLAVLPQEGEMHFGQIRRNILDCLLPYMDKQLYQEKRLHIVEPSWVEIRIYMGIIASRSAKSYLLREKIRRRIQEFLHPVSGNFDHNGWRIGTLPNAVQIANLCNQMEEILYMQHISLEQESGAGIYILGCSGQHKIEITTEEGESECF